MKDRIPDLISAASGGIILGSLFSEHYGSKVMVACGAAAIVISVLLRKLNV